MLFPKILQVLRENDLFLRCAPDDAVVHEVAVGNDKENNDADFVNDPRMNVKSTYYNILLSQRMKGDIHTQPLNTD